MDPPRAVPAISPTARHDGDQLPGGVGDAWRRRLFWRLLWFALALSAVTLFFISLPTYYEQLRTLAGPDIGDPVGVRRGLAQLSLSPEAYAAYVFTLELIWVLGFVGVALVIARRKFDDPMGLFVSAALIVFATSLSRAPLAFVDMHPEWEAAVELLSTLGFIAFLVGFYLFPDGRFVPHWTRWLVIAWVVVEIEHYFFPKPPLSPTGLPGFLLFLGLLASGVYAQIYRYRRVSSPVARQQTKWVASGLTAMVVGFVVYGVTGELVEPGVPELLHDMLAGTLLVGSLLLVPLSIGAAILRHRLWDIDIIINRTLVYGALTFAVVALYVLIVGGVGTLLQARGNLLIALIATGLVAVTFQPLRERVQRAINRLMFGERDAPYVVLSRLGRRLEELDVPEAVLPSVTQTVREALRLPYAAFALYEGGDPIIVAADGVPSGELLRLALTHQGEHVGDLLAAPRAPGEPFSPADRRLLEDLARQAGVAVHAAQLIIELRRSRERLIVAREEERRRLRHDLHDGVGPTLASLIQRLDTAAVVIPERPASAASILGDLKRDVRMATAEIRRIVHALRPAALDEIGLVAAVRAEAERQSSAGQVHVLVDAPDELPPLPAAVEVAAFRIVSEAVTNVVRHAGAARCEVRIEVNGALNLEVTDDGRGLPTERRSGVGLASMRARTEELGGVWSIVSRPSGGTCIRARLPLAQE